MQRQSVLSSNIHEIGYDGGLQILEVEFNDGSIYQYLSVPEEKYSCIMAADSKGKYLNSEIKPFYEYLKIKDED